MRPVAERRVSAHGAGPARVVVTGGAGFIGSHVAEALLARRWEVTVFDDLSTGSYANVPAGARFLEADVLDASRLRDALRGAQVVVHLAAVSSVLRSLNDPQGVYRINAEGALSVLEAARHEGVNAIVLASSAAVYAESRRPRNEISRLGPQSMYGAAKLAMEQSAMVYGRLYGMHAVNLRYFNVYGPRQRPDLEGAGVMPIWVDQLRSGAPLDLFGDGRNTRDFTYVLDVARGTADAVEGAWRGRLSGALNLATGRSVTLSYLAALLSEVAGTPLRVRRLASRAGDLRHSRADITRARKLLAYEPSVPLELGVQHTLLAFGIEPVARSAL